MGVIRVMATVKSDKSMVECICPKCSIEHEKLIFYTGTSKPKMLCRRCSGKWGGSQKIVNPYSPSAKRSARS